MQPFLEKAALHGGHLSGHHQSVASLARQSWSGSELEAALADAHRRGASPLSRSRTSSTSAAALEKLPVPMPVVPAPTTRACAICEFRFDRSVLYDALARSGDKEEVEAPVSDLRARLRALDLRCQRRDR